MIRIGIHGAAGRMGLMIAQAAFNCKEIEIAGGWDIKGHKNSSKDIGLLAGMEKADILLEENGDEIIEKSDIIITFSTPYATIELIKQIKGRRAGLVIGTTGFTKEQEDIVLEASCYNAIVKTSNFSIGINLLLSLVKNISSIYKDDADIEIVEFHHKHKKDAPSGTAISLGKSIADGLKIDYYENAVFGRSGITSERPSNQIGIHAVRAGEIVGKHNILFAAKNEEIEIIHNAKSRAVFAEGALRACIWLYGKKPGLYDMKDVLGLNKEEQ
ncbi:MAG: 4-hydroxy-tetrahydrodipicolinate reductase [Candidatus Coatesbacteria bacterium]|nr:4-hydroxy-tetrahydrodipicolinate reductase [Candidatus Coatesbacteria bacterium]